MPYIMCRTCQGRLTSAMLPENMAIPLCVCEYGGPQELVAEWDNLVLAEDEE